MAASPKKLKRFPRAICVEPLEGRQLLSAAAFQVKDIFPGSSDSNPGPFTAIGSSVFFTASPQADDQQLFVSDGTAAGTKQLTNVNEAGGAIPYGLTAVNGTLFFAAQDPTHGTELWKSDGTVAGTSLVRDIYPGGAGDTVNSSTPHGLVSFHNELYFVADDGDGEQIWKSDGTTAGTVKVTNINPDGGTSFDDLVVQNGTLYFYGDDVTHGPGLWKSDGTAAGTSLVQVTGTAAGGGGVEQLTPAANQLFFDAFDPTNGYQVWVSDGTPGGTHPVKIIDPGIQDSLDGPQNLTTIGNTLYFSADDGTTGRQLWQSDGTSAGTKILKVINPGLAANPTSLTVINTTLYFAAEDNTDGVELWKSDGTTAGTVLVKDMDPGAGSSSPSGLINVNGTLYFNADDGSDGFQLWSSDGTANGTQMLPLINQTGDAFVNSDGLNQMAVANGLLFFDATDGNSGQELWAYRAFTPGAVQTTTTLVTSLSPAGEGSVVTFTATVSGTGGIPTGTVTFYDNGVVLSPATLDGNGNASVSTSTLTVGDHVIAAQYSGDSTFTASSSVGLTETISARTATTIGVTSSANPALIGASVTFDVNVLGTGGTPTGTVNFYDGSTLLGSGTLDSSGGASFSTSSLAAGDHSIVAVYQGDNTFAASPAAIVNQTISTTPPSPLVPDLTKAAGSLPASVVGGAKLKNRVPVLVSNPTGATVAGVVTIKLYASTDPNSIDGAIAIGTITRHVSIKSQKSLKLQIKVPTFPASLLDGTYSVMAQLTDENGLTRLTALPATVQVAAPFVSPAATLSGLTPASIAPGKHASVTLVISNNGNVDFTGPVSIDIEPVPQSVMVVSPPALLTTSKKIKIKHGASVKIKLRVTVSAALPPGIYLPSATLVLDGMTVTAEGTSFTVT